MSTAADSLLPAWSQRLLSELDAADRRAESVAKGLSTEQLNWHPSRSAWSVGQCLEHLRVSNEVYLAAISASLEGRQRGAVDDVRLGWFSRRFIRNYVAPNPGGAKARAPRKIEPTKKIESSILESFFASNQGARELVRRA